MTAAFSDLATAHHRDRIVTHGTSARGQDRRRRCGLTVRFIPPEARQARANSLDVPRRPILLRGQDPWGHSPETTPPF